MLNLNDLQDFVFSPSGIYRKKTTVTLNKNGRKRINFQDLTQNFAGREETASHGVATIFASAITFWGGAILAGALSLAAVPATLLVLVAPVAVGGVTFLVENYLTVRRIYRNDARKEIRPERREDLEPVIVSVQALKPLKQAYDAIMKMDDFIKRSTRDASEATVALNAGLESFTAMLSLSQQIPELPFYGGTPRQQAVKSLEDSATELEAMAETVAKLTGNSVDGTIAAVDLTRELVRSQNMMMKESAKRTVDLERFTADALNEINQ